MDIPFNPSWILLLVGFLMLTGVGGNLLKKGVRFFTDTFFDRNSILFSIAILCVAVGIYFFTGWYYVIIIGSIPFVGFSILKILRRRKR